MHLRLRSPKQQHQRPWRTWWKFRFFRFHALPNKKLQRWSPELCVFNNLSRWFWSLLRFENHCHREWYLSCSRLTHVSLDRANFRRTCPWSSEKFWRKMEEKGPRTSYEYVCPAPWGSPGKEDAEHFCEVPILISWYVNSLPDEDAVQLVYQLFSWWRCCSQSGTHLLRLWGLLEKLEQQSEWIL